jgi:hypothetical protein
MFLPMMAIAEGDQHFKGNASHVLHACVASYGLHKYLK